MSLHTPVLLTKVIELLDPHTSDVVVDATFGRGGHARSICRRIGGSGMLIGIDKDQDAIRDARHFETELPCRLALVHADFREVQNVLENMHVGSVHRILFDLGMSSPQVDQAERGFSFAHEGPLDMRLDRAAPLSAHDVVNTWSEDTLTDVIYGFGNERKAARIARAIVRARKEAAIKTTTELAHIIFRAAGGRKNRRTHPATKTFQAIRIAVNSELDALETALPRAWDVLASGGRIAVISFHSLEDRTVKNFFRGMATKKDGIYVNKKPVRPHRMEIEKNPRARSAALRVIEKR